MKFWLKFSSIYYREPSKELDLIAVTGTNGKTSITYIIKSIFDKKQIKTGLIGTLGSITDNKVIDIKNTTLNPLKYKNI